MLAACLDDESKNVCNAAIDLLAATPPPSVSQDLTLALTRYLERKDVVDHGAVFLVLEKLAPSIVDKCDANAILLLASCIHCGDQGARSVAENMLRRIAPKGDERVLSVLRTVLQHESHWKCHSAILGLMYCAA